jgi:hypothetical protein
MSQAEENARVLARFITKLGGFPYERRNVACYAHMGATICDAILQAGLNYRTVVAPRVRAILRRWPSANTTSSFRRLLQRYEIARVIDWRDVEKPRRIVELTEFCYEQSLETETCLQIWLVDDNNAHSLLNVRGVGPKTVDYLKTLVGLPAVAVDRHLRAFVSWAGLDLGDYEEISTVVGLTADLLGVHRGSLDHAIWSYVSNSRTARRPIRIGCKQPLGKAA